MGSDHGYNLTRLDSTDSLLVQASLSQVQKICLLVESSPVVNMITSPDSTELNLVAASCNPVGYLYACVISWSMRIAEVFLNNEL